MFLAKRVNPVLGIKYSRFTGKCNTLRHWSSLYPLPGQGFQVKAHVANLFEMTITPQACAPADLLVVIPWILSDVISGKPKLLRPYVELARYAAEYRNYYWQKSRTEQGKTSTIRRPPDENCHPYPSSKQEASDEAEDDKGGNFGRIARAGILDEYINSLKEQDYLGIKIMHWIAFFKAIAETRADVEIDRKLSSLRAQIQSERSPSQLEQTQLEQTFLEILDRLEGLWRTASTTATP